MSGDESKAAMPPAILYAAKSTEDKRGSIPTQLADCRELAEREGWEVAGEFQDEAASAYSGNRGPGLAAARELAERLAPSVLVVQHSDRLARGDGRTADHLNDIYVWAVKAGVTIRTVQDDLFADPRIGRVMSALMGMRNTEDSARKSEAVKSGLKRRAERGHWHGPCPLGYVRAEDGSGIRPDRSEAAVVRRIFREYADAGKSMSEITRRLQADAVPTKTGSNWGQSTVSSILRNPVYIGQVTFLGEPVDGVHKPIIKQELWDRTAKRLAARQSRGRGRPSKGNHLFTGGMLRCGSCGEAMVPRTLRGGEFYYCRGRAELGQAFCSVKTIPRAAVDEAVLDYFTRVGLDLEATKRQVVEADSRRLAEVRGRREAAERNAIQLAADGERVEREFRGGDLTAKRFEALMDKIEAESVAVAAEADRLRASEAEIERDAAELDTEGEALRLLNELQQAVVGQIQSADGIDAVRAALGRLFSSFELHPVKDGEERGRIRAHIREDAIELVEDGNGQVTRKLRREGLALINNQRRSSVPS